MAGGARAQVVGRHVPGRLLVFANGPGQVVVPVDDGALLQDPQGAGEGRIFRWRRPGRAGQECQSQCGQPAADAGPGARRRRYQGNQPFRVAGEGGGAPRRGRGLAFGGGGFLPEVGSLHPRRGTMGSGRCGTKSQAMPPSRTTMRPTARSLMSLGRARHENWYWDGICRLGAGLGDAGR